jgi:hypothetical protein
MATRPNRDSKEMVPYEWEILLDYNGPDGKLTQVRPEDQGHVNLTQTAKNFMDEIAAYDKKEYLMDFDPNAPLANEHWLGNLYNISLLVLREGEVQASFDNMIRSLKTAPLPLEAAGWRIQITWECKPAPSETPPGWGWFFQASKTTAVGYEEKFKSAFILRQLEFNE